MAFTFSNPAVILDCRRAIQALKASDVIELVRQIATPDDADVGLMAETFCTVPVVEREAMFGRPYQHQGQIIRRISRVLAAPRSSRCRPNRAGCAYESKPFPR
ncbi:hypothetical protein [Mesorhizobium shangrilense]|uniref:Uncharacterized protein n=1 Tax=Mesorhizobium shangrilense TaxID=460060 RepID=A0ABV2DPU5_9HYPH